MLTVDNEKHFDSGNFRKFCYSIGMTIVFISIYHPESSCAIERVNREVCVAITKTFDVVENYYLYNAIFTIRFTNKFSAIVHLSYLCTKMLVLHIVITVFGIEK